MTHKTQNWTLHGSSPTECSTYRSGRNAYPQGYELVSRCPGRYVRLSRCRCVLGETDASDCDGSGGSVGCDAAPCQRRKRVKGAVKAVPSAGAADGRPRRRIIVCGAGRGEAIRTGIGRVLKPQCRREAWWIAGRSLAGRAQGVDVGEIVCPVVNVAARQTRRRGRPRGWNRDGGGHDPRRVR